MTTVSRSRSTAHVLALALLMASVLGAQVGAQVGGAAAAPAKAPTEVYFIAGVADSPVEVVLDGEVRGSMQPKEIMGPVTVARGEHSIEFQGEGWTARARTRLDRPSTDVIVHRPADPADDPVVTVFPNEVGPIAADRARVTVAHTAVVPPADVRVAGEVLFENIANGEFVTAEVPADTYSVDIVPTGETTPVFGPVDLEVTAGALNRVFAIGRPQNGSMDAVVQVIELRTTSGEPPTSVDAGSAGLVAPPAGETPERGAVEPSYLLLAVLTGLAGLVGAARLAAHTRRRLDGSRYGPR